jgi:transcriptional regulator with XRE-family HTH domain
MRNQEFITPIDQFVIDFVRHLRDSKKLRQQDIGSIIGVSREYIKDIESTNRRAKYNIRHINALAEYFEMSPKDFLPEKPMKLYFKGRETNEAAKKNQASSKSLDFTKKSGKNQTNRPRKK